MTPGTFYRRNLPHWQPEGAALFITWRLYGSLPRVTARGDQQRCTDKNICATEMQMVDHEGRTGRNACATATRMQMDSESLAKTNFLEFDSALDKLTTGPLWLKNPRIARILVETIQKGETPLGYFLISAFVVMPNHVHILIYPRATLARITKGIKGASARKANEILHTTGKPFWQEESFDHWIRTHGEYESIHAYIERNPVTAGLVKEPEEWPWSSANIAFKTWKEARK